VVTVALPAGDARIVCTTEDDWGAARDAQVVANKTARLTLSFLPRWSARAGAERPAAPPAPTAPARSEAPAQAAPYVYRPPSQPWPPSGLSFRMGGGSLGNTVVTGPAFTFDVEARLWQTAVLQGGFQVISYQSNDKQTGGATSGWRLGALADPLSSRLRPLGGVRVIGDGQSGLGAAGVVDLVWDTGGLGFGRDSAGFLIGFELQQGFAGGQQGVTSWSIFLAGRRGFQF
jgi:hypothetical protein